VEKYGNIISFAVCRRQSGNHKVLLQEFGWRKEESGDKVVL
jgi:hypothetical protein